ncbi:unnamed protein product, partial [marine sediment metagenome]
DRIQYTDEYFKSEEAYYRVENISHWWSPIHNYKRKYSLLDDFHYLYEYFKYQARQINILQNKLNKVKKELRLLASETTEASELKGPHNCINADCEDTTYCPCDNWEPEKEATGRSKGEEKIYIPHYGAISLSKAVTVKQSFA